MPSPLRVALVGDDVIIQRARLDALVDWPIEFELVPDAMPDDKRVDVVAGADAVIAIRFDVPVRHSPSLRLLQTASAGYEKIDFACLPERTVVCNATGHGHAIAEHVLMSMLMFCNRWREVDESFRSGSWRHRGMTYRPLRNELRSQTVGVLGFGHIGQAVAAVCRALGIRVVVCARKAPEQSAADAYVPFHELDTFLGQCDFVVICLAHSPQTEGIIDAQRLARMKASGVLINVARGALIDEQGLYHALRDRRIAGAAIDTWWRYPDRDHPDRRGSSLPFHELPNVLMTPHVSAWSEQAMDQRWLLIRENLQRFAQGRPLAQVVREGEAQRAR